MDSQLFALLILNTEIKKMLTLMLKMKPSKMMKCFITMLGLNMLMLISQFKDINIILISIKKTKDIKYFTTIYFTNQFQTLKREIKIVIPKWLNIELKELNFNGYDITKKRNI